MTTGMSSGWRRLRRGLGALTQRERVDREIADEVAHYLEQATLAHQARGLSATAARRAAQLEMGSLPGVREQVREWGWENTLDAVWMDLRHAARRPLA